MERVPALPTFLMQLSGGTSMDYSEIMGCKDDCYDKVCNTIKNCVRIKKVNNLPVTIGLQMVLLPDFSDQIMPLVKLGKNMQVDYLVIKHCSDDEYGSLGINYSRYFSLVDILQKLFLITVIWLK
jgi:hypothetical protein